MYKCEDCGGVFDEYDAQTVSEDRGFFGEGRAYEDITVRRCPHCGSEYFEKAYVCEDCGEAFLEDEITFPYCLCDDCLRDRITLESFLEFAMNSETGLCDYRTVEVIEDFMFTKVFKFSSHGWLRESNLRLKRWLAKAYCDMALDPEESEQLLTLAREYVLTGATECKNEFSEFLYWKELENAKRKNA